MIKEINEDKKREDYKEKLNKLADLYIKECERIDSNLAYEVMMAIRDASPPRH